MTAIITKSRLVIFMITMKWEIPPPEIWGLFKTVVPFYYFQGSLRIFHSVATKFQTLSWKIASTSRLTNGLSHGILATNVWDTAVYLNNWLTGIRVYISRYKTAGKEKLCWQHNFVCTGYKKKRKIEKLLIYKNRITYFLVEA